MEKKTILLLIIFLISNVVSSQNTGYNLDFETGTFIGWQAGKGRCCPVVIKNSGIVKGRHTIMSGNGVDLKTCKKLSVVAPGGSYSARLGNDSSGGEAETLSYTLTITPENSLFIYKYAVVLQDPGHEPAEQPYFRVNVYNENRELIDPTCGAYNVVATIDLPGFQTCEEFNVVYKDWTTVGLDLSPYIGQKITVEFETSDCSIGGHFGYAYIDAFYSSLTIGSSYCTDANAVTLSAPIGFSYLWETGQTTQNIKINNPIDGKKYGCELTSATGCKVAISTVVNLQDPIVNFEVYNVCDKKEVIFKNTSLNSASTLNTYKWDFGDGTTSTVENPTHIFPAPGNYNVTFEFVNILGCKFSKTQNVTINLAPEPTLTDGVICFDSLGNLAKGFTLNSGLSSGDNEYKWFLNSELINDATKSTYTAVEKGNYSVLVTDMQTSCSSQAFATVVSSQMASDVIVNLSKYFADTNFLNVDVVGGSGPFLFKLDDYGFQQSNFYSGLSIGDHFITVKDSVNCTLITKQFTIFGFPKFFTPNNDGFNDYWNIPNYKKLFQAQIYIFDRYGKFIKEIAPSGLGWDGTHLGNLMPAADYWFTLNYKEEDQRGNLESKTFRSHFSLKR
ncbi:gliding motility-associated-like protein [Flavobacterium sp. CG_23.5]|uniref:T9SS type B sorting domain-containing protein n=1 Tax=Flavobacterium sp. CG_23.5 TaxID=2760708 RepID=UPI001AE6FB24|nr:T9SS type B sorting domain-containing protein [Flavobacterium sp. CG_23.5]MBP2282259.1 gliding motility-associated-like protein [Flavobacterium sp. CG_23.5]